MTRAVPWQDLLLVLLLLTACPLASELGCRDAQLTRLLREASLLSGAPQAGMALVELQRLQWSDKALWESCPVAPLVVRLGHLYLAGANGNAGSLRDFEEDLARLDLDEADLFALTGLSRPMMAHAFWLMSGATPKELPRWLRPLAREGSLAWDLGTGRGDDAAFYLALNFSVLAVDASPGPRIGRLAKIRARQRSEGHRLQVLPRVLAAEAGAADVVFFVCGHDVTRSTTDAALGRNPHWCEDAQEVKLPSVTCGELVEKYGTPVHVKVDVEGADQACLESLLWDDSGTRRASLPQSLSVEAAAGHAGHHDVGASLQLLETLERAGYRSYKFCRQAAFNPPYWGDSLASSGPFGEAATDWKAGLSWRSASEVAADFFAAAEERLEGRLVAEWFDLHAALPKDPATSAPWVWQGDMLSGSKFWQ